MPTYDYRCDANGRVIEVKHRMSENVHNWGELCRLAGLETGMTDAMSPVRRLATGGNIVKRSSSVGAGHACHSGACCGGSGCGLPEQS